MNYLKDKNRLQYDKLNSIKNIRKPIIFCLTRKCLFFLKMSKIKEEFHGKSIDHN